MTPSFQGEVQFRRYSDTSTQGAQVVLALDDRDSLNVFIGKEGRRYMAVLVEIGDDEQPVQPTKAEKPKASPIGDLCRWSVIRCGEPTFWEFLNTTFPSADTVASEDEAGDLLKFVCNVKSRKDFDTDPKARAYFDRLIRHPYQKWVIAKGLA